MFKGFIWKEFVGSIALPVKFLSEKKNPAKNEIAAKIPITFFVFNFSIILDN